MTRFDMRGCTTLLLLATLSIAQIADAQTTPDVLVRSRQLPAAEAPRSSYCEAVLAGAGGQQQQVFSADGELIDQRLITAPTRLPRNPDYSAPPLVPVGGPLPILPKARFGVGAPVYAAQPGTGYVASSAQIANSSAATGGDPSGSVGTLSDSIALECQTAYVRGADTEWLTPPNPGGVEQSAAIRGFATARAFIARNDRTLPMALALFDQRRFAESLPWFRKASTKLSYRQGGDEAMLYVGKLYLQGLGAQSNPAEGVKWLRKAANQPFSPLIDTPAFDPRQPERNTAVGEAAIMLANVYRTGFAGIPRDPLEARKWYERADKVGHLPAAKMLGDLYARGTGVPRDMTRAVRYYRRAARYDLTDAQLALARILEIGSDGVPADPKAALAWYRAAAANGNGDAAYAVARAYDSGTGLPPDQQKALAYYKTAALSGVAPARVAIGTYFHEGKVLPRDDAVARQWFAAAARDRDADGMFNLAALLANGRGGPRDLPQAWVWLKRAAVNGHPDAPAAVAKVEALMNPAERQAAAAQLARG